VLETSDSAELGSWSLRSLLEVLALKGEKVLSYSKAALFLVLGNLRVSFAESFIALLVLTNY